MKNITKIIPIICFLVVSILSIFFFDTKQSRTFFEFENMKKDTIDISYSEDIKVNNDLIRDVLKLAKEHNLLVEKINTSAGTSGEKNIYLSFDTSEDLMNFLYKKFKIKKLNNKIDNNTDYFISTYEHKSDNQIGLIPDLLNNNKYNYYTFERLFKDNENLYGPYIIYYKNYSDYSYFVEDAGKLLGQCMRSAYGFSFNNSESFFMVLILGSIIILMLFYFIFQVYEAYYKSKKIGCMKLLGFSKEKIAKNMMKKRLKAYFIITLAILLSTMFIKNVNLTVLIGVLTINLLLILLTFLINYLCIRIILHGYQISNIIKKQNIAIKISKVNNKLKIAVMILLLISISILFNSISSLQSSIRIYNSNKDLFDYGVIETFNGSSENIYQYEKHSNFYQYIVDDKRLNTFYAEFSSREREPANDMEKELFSKWEEEGSFFVYNSVDRNYLKLENIKVYDESGNIVDIDNIDGIFFIFPKSKKDKIEKFESYYKSYSKGDYEKYNINTEFKYYLYDDQKLNTYSIDPDLKYIDSTILRVIDKSLRISYMESPVGIDTFGTSLDTGLKIQIGENRSETYKALEENIIAAGLDDCIDTDNFVAYADYFSREIQIYQTVFVVSIVVILVVLLVYTIVSLQTISLYVKTYSRQVTVKYLLGFEKNDIFSKVIKNNIKHNLIAFVLTAFVLYIIGLLNIFIYLLSVAAFSIIDFIVLYFVIKFYNLSKVYIQLKGGNND